MNILDVSQVSKTFPGSNVGTLALQSTEFSVSENDFISILGPSGRGKSTLLRRVAGLEMPSSGQIALDGQPVSRPGADHGMVFQSYTLFPWPTVLQSVCVGLREKGLAPAEQQSIARQFMAKVGLADFGEPFSQAALGGMQQRTALARALANNPRILLMDEPFGAIDHQTRELMRQVLHGIWEAEQATVLFVTHDIDEAIFMGNRVMVMSARPGRIKCDLVVPIEHLRGYSVKTTPELVRMKAQLTEEIRVEV